MKQKEIQEIINKVYTKIADNYSGVVIPKVELHNSIYARLSGISEMSGEVNPHAEYDWYTNKIHLYIPKMKDEEQIIRSLIHECVHSTQPKRVFDKYYEDGETYDTHPYEIEAHEEEENWKKYKIK